MVLIHLIAVLSNADPDLNENSCALDARIWAKISTDRRIFISLFTPFRYLSKFLLFSLANQRSLKIQSDLFL